ncbi:hypothetical protein LTR95_006018 [Oleoguttula sp. CCFEE 5521]
MKATFPIIAFAFGLGALASPMPEPEPQGYGSYGNGLCDYSTENVSRAWRYQRGANRCSSSATDGKYGSYGTYPKLAAREAAAAPAPGYGNYGNSNTQIADSTIDGKYGTYNNYPKNAVREAAPNPEAEADADLAALEDLVFAIKSKRANYATVSFMPRNVVVQLLNSVVRQLWRIRKIWKASDHPSIQEKSAVYRTDRISSYGSYPREAEPEAAAEATPEAVPAPAE